MRRYRHVEEIGNAHGRIALYLDESEAIELAEHYGPGDTAYRELMDAVERAYPKEDEDAPGIAVVLKDDGSGRLMQRDWMLSKARSIAALHYAFGDARSLRDALDVEKAIQAATLEEFGEMRFGFSAGLDRPARIWLCP